MSTASARAYDLIRSLILEGRFAPGERLKEEELTELCGVSRTPVREGLRRLAIEGLVVVTPHQGAQVAAVGEGEPEGAPERPARAGPGELRRRCPAACRR